MSSESKSATKKDLSVGWVSPKGVTQRSGLEAERGEEFENVGLRPKGAPVGRSASPTCGADQLCRLSDIADIQGGYAFKSTDFGEEGIAVIKIANIQPPLVSLIGVDRVEKNKLKGLERFRLNNGDVLMAMTGATVGKVGRFKGPEIAYLNQRVARISAKEGKEFDDFIYAVVSQPGFDAYIEGASAGSAQANISAAGIGSISIPKLTSSEMLAIGNVAKSLDDRITLLRETNATLEAIAQALFKSWFVDFDPVHANIKAAAEGWAAPAAAHPSAVSGPALDTAQNHPHTNTTVTSPVALDPSTAALFPNSFQDSELGLIPEGWRIGNIGEIADVIDCLHSKKPELLSQGRPYLQLSNIRDDGLLDTSEVACISDVDYQKWISRLEASSGDCVITNVGRVGAVAQIPDGFNAAMGRNMTGIRLKAEYPYPTYLVELLMSSWMREEIKKKTDVGTILDALNVRSIPTLRCIRAPDSVLNEFESLSRPLRKKMEENLQKETLLSQLRDTLLPRLISGQLRLPDAQEKIEEALA